MRTQTTMEDLELQQTRRAILVALLKTRHRDPICCVINDADIALAWVRYGAVVRAKDEITNEP